MSYPILANIFNPLAPPYNAAMNGVIDDTEAIQVCLDDASNAGGTVLIQGSTLVTAPLTLTGADIIAAPKNSQIQYEPTGPNPGPLLTITNPNATPLKVAGLTLIGNGGAVLGGNQGAPDGLSIAQGLVEIEGCQFSGFRYGIAQNSPTAAHTYIDMCDIVSCYAGIAILQSAGDLFVHRSRVTSLFANLLLTDAGGQVVIRDSDFGGAPYGIYQFASSPTSAFGAFLTECILERVTMNVGNGAIFTERAYTSPGLFDALTTDLLMTGCIITFDDTLKLSSRTRDYAVVLGGIAGDCQISTGINHPPTGALGTLYVQDFLAGKLSLRGRGYSQADVTSPNPNPANVVIVTGF